MLKLGIIGSDNSHAIAFASLANLDEGYNGLRVDGVQVTHLYGTDDARNKEVAGMTRIPNVVTSLDDMMGKVDGVICVWRHGSKHTQDTLPFLNAGVPAFVDKPLATTVSDATALIDAAEKAKVGFTSFSTLRYAEGMRDFIASLANAGSLTAGMSSGPADRYSEYDGIFFYGIHAVEMMNAVWGYGCKSVTAVENGKNIQAVCAFDDGAMVTLNLLGDAKYVFHVAAFGTEGHGEYTVDSGTCYHDGLKIIVETMTTGKWPLTREQLLEPVKILLALELSLKEQRTVALEELVSR